MYIHIKRFVAQVFFLIIVTIFIYLCIFGKYGLIRLHQLEEKNKSLQSEINLRHETLEQLKKKVAVWNNYSFFKEKEAREKLHMAYKDDIVYYIEKQ